MRKILWTVFSLWLCGMLISARADTYSMADGTSLTGDIVSFDDVGVKFRMADDSYSDRVPWTKFSQDGLKQLSENPKIKPLVEPFIEIPQSERPPKPEIQVQDVTRLEMPPPQSLFGALFSSSVGIFVLLLVYAANLYAAFEIAVVRSRPIPLVMGASAVLPVLGPVIFLSLPMPARAAPAEAPMEAQADPQTYAMPGAPKDDIKIVAGSWQAQSPPAAEKPEPQIFQRGEFMFNRRFFETKFPAFFTRVHGGHDRQMALIVKISGGQLVVEHIARIANNEIYFEVVQGGEHQEIMVPFGDIHEIQLQPKDT